MMCIKKTAAWLMSLVLLLLPPCAHAEGQTAAVGPRNTTSIRIYDQDAYTAQEWTLFGYVGRDLASSGCFVFTFAHALQWLTGEAADDALLRSLLATCRDPNGNYGHASCAHSPMSGPAYFPFNRSQGFPLANAPEPAADAQGLVTEDGLARFFRRGYGVLCVHGAGHFILLTEEKEVDGVSYVHVVDSHWGSVHLRTGSLYYFQETDEWGRAAMRAIRPDPATEGYGGDYWMEAKDLARFFSFVFAWREAGT